MRQLPPSIVCSDEVKSALEKGFPVVALESTVLTHGLPYPQSMSVQRELEDILREGGTVPATIIMLDGQARVGLSPADVDELESRLRQGHAFQKLSRRDLPLAISRGISGGTTVSATLHLAGLCGIEVFATGGIGGVHRGFSKLPDFSGDLIALATTPVAVVSAGCKAILDVPATLEVLETLAVPVLGWQTDSFPLFYTRSSDFLIDQIGTPEDFAAFWLEHRALNGGAVLVANPIPAEAELPAPQIATQIELALWEARAKGISGKALTPFLLDFLARATKGASVTANLALLKNNARLAAILAKALKEQR